MQMMNIRDFAHALGTHTRLTLEASLPFHTAYTKADTEGRDALRVEWAIGYISGRENVSAARAAKIWAAGKGNDAIDAGACNRAQASFNHHVIRAEKSQKVDTKPVQVARIRLPAGTVERFADAYAGLTKAQIIEAHERALASLVFE
jgi:hypothetical protein